MNKKRLKQTIGLLFCRGSNSRGKYLREKHIMDFVGEHVRYQPYIVPLYPELIRLHNNISVGAGTRFITHDATFGVLNHLENTEGKRFPERVGCIEVMDNVFIGYNVTILPNVKIGRNVIIGACSTVTKDLESDGVYVGTPAKRIGTFQDYVQKCSENSEGGYNYPYVRHNQNISKDEIQRAWEFFASDRDW